MTEPHWRFVHISDTHISPDPAYAPPWVERAPAPLVSTQALVTHLNALPFAPDFILHTGDVACDPLAEAYHAARDVFSALKAPVYYLPGNHDDAGLLQQVLLDRSAEDVTLPFDHTFDHHGLQIACLDSTVGDAHAPVMSDQQLDWLEFVCAAPDDRPLIVAVHHLVLPVGVPWLDDRMRIQNGERVHRALLKARHRLRGVFFGHIHQPVTVVRDGILYSATGSAWYQLHAYPTTITDEQDFDARAGYSVVTVTNGQTFIRRHTFPLAGWSGG